MNQRVAELQQKIIVVNEHETHILLKDIIGLKPKRLLLFNLLQSFGFNETSVDDLISVLGKHSGRVFESANFKLILDRDKLILTTKNKGQQPCVLINIQDKEINYAHYKLNILHDDSPLIVKNNPMAVSIDAGLLIYPLTLRRWQQGDYFVPLGMKGRKKVSDFFVGEKVSLHQKDKIPLLINGNGDIMWIGGYRLADNYKVTQNTKKVVIFELVNLTI
ncbi:MAG: tRNA lysidine(34) synthetase TilS [Mucilaginibacter sp.]